MFVKLEKRIKNIFKKNFYFVIVLSKKVICYILGMIFLIWDLYNFYNEYLFVIVFFFGVG